MSNWANLTQGVLSRAFDTFAESAVYWPKSEPSFSISGIFDSNFQNQTATAGAILQSSEIKLGVNLAQFPAEPNEGDKVQIRGKTYRVIEFRPDGNGGADLILQAGDDGHGVFYG